jgi:hypothetical protein
MTGIPGGYARLPAGCRSVHAGMVPTGRSERSRAKLEEQARQQLQNTGYEEISLHR